MVPCYGHYHAPLESSVLTSLTQNSMPHALASLQVLELHVVTVNHGNFFPQTKEEDYAKAFASYLRSKISSHTANKRLIVLRVFVHQQCLRVGSMCCCARASKRKLTVLGIML